LIFLNLALFLAIQIAYMMLMITALMTVLHWREFAFIWIINIIKY
jgi:hypothetical protein